MSTEHLSQTCKNLLAVLFVVIVLALIIVLGGCSKTVYWYKGCHGEGANTLCVEGRAETRRKFKSLVFDMDPETGALRLEAQDVETSYSPLEYAAAEVIGKFEMPNVPE